jgi:hypothetical protein
VDTYIIEWILQKPMRDAQLRAAREKRQLDKEEAEAAKKNNKLVEYEDEATSPPLPFYPVAEPGEQGKSSPQQKRAKPKRYGDLALKTIAFTKLGRDIQNAGKAGHDSFEDAMAARDLVHWHICNPRS